MKKIFKIRILNAILYAAISTAGIYWAFIRPDSNSAADGRFKGLLIGFASILLALCLGLAIKKYKETHDIRESLKVIAALFTAALSIRWFKRVKKRKK